MPLADDCWDEPPKIDHALAPSDSGPPLQACQATAVGGRAYVVRSSFVVRLASLALGITIFVLLVLSMLCTSIEEDDWAKPVMVAILVGFSVLIDGYLAAVYVATLVTSPASLVATWRESDAPTTRRPDAAPSGWVFHLYEFLYIFIWAFIGVCSLHSNGTFIGAWALSFVLAAVHAVCLFAPLQRIRLIMEVRPKHAQFVTLGPTEELDPALLSYGTMDAVRCPKALESGFQGQ